MESTDAGRRGGMNRFQNVAVQGRKLMVYLPPSYQGTERRYPVAYVQDGGSLISDCANYLELLYRENRLPELILIGVETPERNNEYTPWPAPALMDGHPGFGGSARPYLDELADVIKPYVDGHYRSKSDAEHTGLIGASFGGMVSMFGGYWRPDTFGRIGMLSASLWYPGVLDYIREEAAPPEQLRIYMSVGSCEGIYKQNIQHGMVSSTYAARDLWIEKGFPRDRLRFEVDAGGTHDPRFMAGRFPEALSFMLGGTGSVAPESIEAGIWPEGRSGRRLPSEGRTEPAISSSAVSGETGVGPAGPADAGGQAAGVAAGDGNSQTAKAAVGDGGVRTVVAAVAAAADGQTAEVATGDGIIRTGDTAGAAATAMSGRAGNGYSVPRTETFALTSSRTGETYLIFVYVPSKPAPEAGYPVLYALDGNACFGSLAEAMRLQSRHPLGLEPGMIVGIGYDTDEPFDTQRRFFDYTVPAKPEDKRPDGTPWPATGGAELFLSFIEEELKPEIERRYPVDRARQALFGHSLGGFFTLYVLMAKPDAFRTYIAGSPSVWWSGSYVLERLPGWLEQARQAGLDGKELMVGVGSEEKPFMVEGAQRVHDLFAAAEGLGMRLRHDVYDGEGHVSVIHPLISRMLRFCFQSR